VGYDMHRQYKRAGQPGTPEIEMTVARWYSEHRRSASANKVFEATGSNDETFGARLNEADGQGLA
jgi:hypothetical protein